ncbi:polyisoprenoid-binding protein [bacterium]|nr:MAG: polyisoprenoid-binding protein [bacterium]
MKAKLALATLVVPVAFAAVVAFHPGVAYAEPAYAQPGAEIAFQNTGAYTVDPAHTSVGFEIEHLGISKVQGRFSKTAGTLFADPKNLAASNIQVTITTDSVDTAVPPRDAHLKSPDFFEVAKFPEITFKSTKISKKGKGFVAEGDFTMKGVTKKVSIPFRVFGPITDPWKNTRIGIVSDPIQLNRQDYGIAYNDKLPDGTPAVGNEVTIKLSLEATLDKPKS